MNLLSAVHQLAWMQYPAIWLCESCAILWLVLRTIRRPRARTGVLLMLCGLGLNALVTGANAGAMPVVGMPSTLRPVGPVWCVATSHTRLPFLADQARLGLFSIGDIALLCGGILIVVTCLQQTAKWRSSMIANGPDGATMKRDRQQKGSIANPFSHPSKRVSYVFPRVWAAPSRGKGRVWGRMTIERLTGRKPIIFD